MFSDLKGEPRDAASQRPGQAEARSPYPRRHRPRNVSRTCRYFGISRDTYYEWLKAYRRDGETGLLPRKRGPRGPHPNRLPQSLEAQILQIRRDFHFGPQRIVWYLQRSHNVRVSAGGVYGTLKRNGMNLLPTGTSVRAIPSWHRHEKEVPGHHVQVDVKFLDPVAEDGRRVRRFQYTAIDDATRIRARKIYPTHHQRTAMAFTDYVLERFPFRVRQIRTDRGHEFQAQFHWHVEDLGIQHVYIKPRTPRLNGKVERSHRTDAMEFYQLLSFKDDVDLEAKLAEWERFYNPVRPHGAHRGKTPYEVLRERLSSDSRCQGAGVNLTVQVLVQLSEPYGFVCRLGIGTGLRWGELVRLQSTDLQDGSLVVHHTKSGKIRRVPVAPELFAELRLRVGWLMPFTDGTGFSRQVRKLSKIERFYPHRMRRTYGCRMLAAGVSLAAVKELLGHSTVLVTERYARLAESMVRRKVERARQSGDRVSA